MRYQGIIIAGFGGQGILSIGRILAQAGMDEGMNVSWLPSYGPEMRGGTAYCHVILSDAPIGSPLLNSATTLIAMNKPSLEKYAQLVTDGGLIIVDGSLIDTAPEDVGAVGAGSGPVGASA
ncbi:MAG: 2-oxoacid:acceptor oxidoreductase family protein, partial [Clostridiales bacterium]|nr:2-oxoacid:acceptor oxidoreductase family protein [Clostridiales bacterium]